MSKQVIFLNEGPHHGTEIEVEPVAIGEHFEHNGCVYRNIDNKYAQFCRKSTAQVKTPKAPKAPKAPKQLKAKKPKA